MSRIYRAGYSYGNGYGYGYGDGDGNGYGYGDGNGDGYGYGDGNGDGNGYGDGDGYPEQEIGGHKCALSTASAREGLEQATIADVLLIAVSG